MTSQQRAHTVGSGVVDPQEHEYRQRQQRIETHRSLRCGCECQHVEQRERQGDIHLREHGVCPVLDGVSLLQVQFADQQIDDGHQVRDKDHALGNATIEVAAEIGHRVEEIDGSDGTDEAVDSDAGTLVDQSRKLPYGQSRHNAEQQHHRLRAQKRCHNGGHKDDASNRSNDEVFHRHLLLISLFLTFRILWRFLDSQDSPAIGQVPWRGARPWPRPRHAAGPR